MIGVELAVESSLASPVIPSGNRHTDVVDQISSRLNLAVASGYANDCTSAVPLLKDAIVIAVLTR